MSYVEGNLISKLQFCCLRTVYVNCVNVTQLSHIIHVDYWADLKQALLHVYLMLIILPSRYKRFFPFSLSFGS